MLVLVANCIRQPKLYRILDTTFRTNSDADVLEVMVRSSGIFGTCVSDVIFVI